MRPDRRSAYGASSGNPGKKMLAFYAWRIAGDARSPATVPFPAMKRFSLFLLSILCIYFPPLHAQEQLLGKISFPNSGSAIAQEAFLKGMLYLHNFEYDDAARSFRRAREIDPDFALAYYGEAKTHNHPIWMRQDRAAAMQVLNELGPDLAARQARAPTQREKDYLYSLEVLYGNATETQGLTKEERDLAYRDYMAALHDRYPEDDEITTFYGLSILGSAHDGRDYRIYMRAAAELFDVWNHNPNHPGAAHYLIHSFDDPTHAPLGLPMAQAYAGIAPGAAHAQHMTSHIFLAMGMWDDVVDANIVARNVQTNRQEELDQRPTVCGHYPWWLQYGYLQKAEHAEAARVLDACYERIGNDPTDSELWHFAIMRAHHVVDGENWEGAGSWTADMGSNDPGARNYLFTDAYAALMSDREDRARQALSAMMKIRSDAAELPIQQKQIEGLLLIQEGRSEEGLDILRDAVKAEEALPIDFGPPAIVKPSLELYADVLLESDRTQEAADAYRRQLQRTPNRRLSQERLAKLAGQR